MVEKYLVEAVKRNVLPITSRCNVRCLFCSHTCNKKGVSVVSLPHVPLAKIKEFLPFLDPNKKIVIGESATVINEGEPLLHPDIREIILAIKKLYPQTPISITTNGLLLTPSMVDFLASQGSIELMVSVNALTPAKRKLIFGYESDIVKTLEYLSRKLPFSASFVFMPHILGYPEYVDSIKKLIKLGVEAVRVFLPGYTEKNKELLKLPLDLKKLAQKLFLEFLEENTPIIVEPVRLKDFQAEVLGVTPRGAANFLKKQDIILTINGKKLTSRIEAHKLLNIPGEKNLEVLRKNEVLSFKFSLNPQKTAGVVFYRDIEEETFQEIIKKVESSQSSSPLILSSPLAVLILKNGLRALGKNYPVFPVKNYFFGGNIECAGLLTVADYILAVKRAWKFYQPDYLLLPGISFNDRGRDLTGKSYLEISDLFNIKTEIL